MKSLTVITVTWNAEATITRTLESVQEQTYSNIEHIIVDGKSTDNTLNIVMRHQHSALRFVSESDKGIYDAMNKGAALATGRYLCFLNAGDTFHDSTTVEKIFDSIWNNTHEPDIIYGQTDIVDELGEFLRHRRLRAPEKLRWTSFKQGMLVCHQAFIVRRQMFEKYDLRYRFSSDVDWCIRMMKKTDHIHNTHLTLINYLSEGMTTANRCASLLERYKIMCEHYGRVSTGFYHLWFLVRGLNDCLRKPKGTR